MSEKVFIPTDFGFKRKINPSHLLSGFDEQFLYYCYANNVDLKEAMNSLVNVKRIFDDLDVEIREPAEVDFQMVLDQEFQSISFDEVYKRKGTIKYYGVTTMNKTDYGFVFKYQNNLGDKKEIKIELKK